MWAQIIGAVLGQAARAVGQEQAWKRRRQNVGAGEGQMSSPLYDALQQGGQFQDPTRRQLDEYLARMTGGGGYV